MLRTASYVVPFVFVLCGGCASTSVRQAQTPEPTLPEAELAPATATVAEAPPPVAGDIQFTITERKAKASPTTDDSSTATTLQPTRSNTSGMTSTGVTTQHIHSSQ